MSFAEKIAKCKGYISGMSTDNRITITTGINKPVEHVWDRYTKPEHITQWNFASPEWRCPRAENDLRTGGRFNSRMEARDGSMGFDFGGTYTSVKTRESLAYTMDDGRTCEVHFSKSGDGTRVDVAFDAESQNPVEMQRGGWQAILGNFKKYAEK